jgi:uncharacterized protein YggE
MNESKADGFAKTKPAASGTDYVRAVRIKSHWKFLGTLFIVLALLAIAYAYYVYLKKQSKKENSVSVQGVGSVTAAPNTARLSFTVQTEANSAEAAAQSNAQQSNQLLTDLRRTDSSIVIRTDNFNIYSFDSVPDSASSEKVFRAVNTIGVQVAAVPKVSKNGNAVAPLSLESRVGALIDAATRGTQSVLVGGASFDLTDAAKAQMMEEARSRAVQNAQNTALILAKSAQRNLGAVQSITDDSGAQPGFLSSVRSKSMNASAPPSTTITAPETIQVEVSVRVVYRLE